jgi:uncharacterized coiled-coil protein SlyX
MIGRRALASFVVRLNYDEDLIEEFSLHLCEVAMSIYRLQDRVHSSLDRSTTAEISKA